MLQTIEFKIVAPGLLAEQSEEVLELQRGGEAFGNYALIIKVEPKVIEGEQYSNLLIELTERRANPFLALTTTDVFYDDLTKPENVGKSFSIQDLKIGENKLEVWQLGGVGEETLVIPRNAYHNITPISKTLGTTIKNWTPHSHQEIDDADDDTFNRWVKEYNNAVENHYVIKEFNQLTRAINSTGAYYEIFAREDYNKYFTNDLSSDAKRGEQGGGTFTTAWEIGRPGAPNGKTKQSFKDDLKNFSAILKNSIDAKEKELTKLRKWIDDWLKEGNLTDPMHNFAVANWRKKLNDNSFKEVKEYEELKKKVENANDHKYYQYKGKFEEESAKTVEGGITASESLGLIKPGLVEIATNEFITADTTIIDKKIAVRNIFRDLRKRAKQVLARKKAVVDLIEGLVKNNNGRDGNKPECPQCHNQFATLSVSRDGINYCSETCAEAAKKEPKTDQVISQAQTAAIQTINDALNQNPKTLTNELDSDFHNWETLIKGFNKVEDINNFRDQVLANIQKRQKEKKNEEEEKDRSEALERESSPENIKNYEELNGRKKYDKTKVNKAIDQAFQKDPEAIKEAIKDVVAAKMTKCGVNESELGSKEKELFSKLKNKEINDKDQLKEAKETLLNFIGDKEVDKKITDLRKRVESTLKSGQKDAIRDELLKLLKEDNIYMEKRKTDINNLLKKSENGSSDTTNNPSPGIPWKIILPIALVVVGVIISVVLVARRRKLKKNKARY